MTFISQCMDLCKTAGTSLTERYACQLSLTVVALGAIGFIGEVFNALEYIKGKRIKYCVEISLDLGTRLALIRYNATVAAGLLVMSLMRLALLYSKGVLKIKWNYIEIFTQNFKCI